MSSARTGIVVDKSPSAIARAVAAASAGSPPSSLINERLAKNPRTSPKIDTAASAVKLSIWACLPAAIAEALMMTTFFASTSDASVNSCVGSRSMPATLASPLSDANSAALNISKPFRYCWPISACAAANFPTFSWACGSDRMSWRCLAPAEISCSFFSKADQCFVSFSGSLPRRSTFFHSWTCSLNAKFIMLISRSCWTAVATSVLNVLSAPLSCTKPAIAAAAISSSNNAIVSGSLTLSFIVFHDILFSFLSIA